MTAGRGIVALRTLRARHRAGRGRMRADPELVALPEADEEVEPAFDHSAARAARRRADGVWMRLIAGAAYGLTSPVAVAHRSSTCMSRCSRRPNSRCHPSTASVPPTSPRAASRSRAALRGRPAAGLRRCRRSGDPRARCRDLMLLGGEPLGERHIWWNFVSSRKERIEQAKADWKAGRIRLPPNDDREFIPLPG